MSEKYNIVTYSIVEEDDNYFWEEKWHNKSSKAVKMLIGVLKSKNEVFRYKALQDTILIQRKKIKELSLKIEELENMINKKQV